MPRKNFCNRGLAGNTYHSRDVCGFLFDARHIVLIWCASVRRRNSPYFAESSPDWSSRALIYPRLRASSRLYEKRRPGFAFPCYARRGGDEELGGCVDGRIGRGRGVFFYMSGSRFREFIFVANARGRDAEKTVRLREKWRDQRRHPAPNRGWTFISF